MNKEQKIETKKKKRIIFNNNSNNDKNSEARRKKNEKLAINQRQKNLNIKPLMTNNRVHHYNHFMYI